MPGIACLATSLIVAVFAHALPLLAVAALLAGFGVAQPTLLALTVDLVPHDRRGAAVATYYVAHESGIATGSIALYWIAQAITRAACSPSLARRSLSQSSCWASTSGGLVKDVSLPSKQNGDVLVA